MRSANENEATIELIFDPVIAVPTSLVANLQIGRLVNSSVTQSDPFSQRITLVVLLPRLPWRGIDNVEVVIAFAAKDFTSKRRFVQVTPTAPSINFTIVLAPQPASVDVTVQKVADVANIAGSIGGPSTTALQLATVASLLELIECAFDHTATLPFSISPFGWCFGDQVGKCYRGAVAANLCLVLGPAAVGITASSLMGWRKYHDGEADSFRSGLISSMATLRYPGILVLSYSFVLQGSVSSSVALLTVSSKFGDYFLGVCGLLVFGLTNACVLLVTTKWFECAIGAAKPAEKSSFEDKIPYLEKFVNMMEWQYDWKDTSVTKFKRRYIFIFRDYHIQWYLAFEFGLAIFQGCLLGVRMESYAVCLGQTLILLVTTLCSFGIFLF